MILENSTDQLSGFFEYIHERQHILVQKNSGLPKPWTNDTILLNWKFCNVFRDDDLSSQWFIQNIRAPLSKDLKRVLFAVPLFRWFNIPMTGETIVNNNLHMVWDKSLAAQEIAKQTKMFSAAYRVKQPPKTGGKLLGTLKVLDDFHTNLDEHYAALLKTTTCQEAYEYLMTIPYFGPFNTYQFVLDLMQTRWNELWPDYKSWCAVGPGGVRGVNWIYGQPVDRKLKPHEAVEYVKSIWNVRPITLDSMWLSDIQHNLCEWDKYNRVHEGGRLKCKYHGAQT